jgi:hypothetical protein
MDELIKQVITKLDLDEEVTRKAIGQVLAFLKKNVGDDFDFSTILSKLQGADSLIAKANEPLPDGKRAEPASPAAGVILQLITWLLSAVPVLDILKKILVVLFGASAVQMIDSAGDGAELIGKLNGLGITKEQGTKVVTMLISFMKQKLGPEVVDDLTEKIPALKAFLDTTKKDK